MILLKATRTSIMRWRNGQLGGTARTLCDRCEEEFTSIINNTEQEGLQALKHMYSRINFRVD
jgi:hypothetical protein